MFAVHPLPAGSTAIRRTHGCEATSSLPIHCPAGDSVALAPASLQTRQKTTTIDNRRIDGRKLARTLMTPQFQRADTPLKFYFLTTGRLSGLVVGIPDKCHRFASARFQVTAVHARGACRGKRKRPEARRRSAGSWDRRQPRYLRRIAVAHIAVAYVRSVHEDRVIQQRSLAVWRSSQLRKKCRGLLDVPGLDFDHRVILSRSLAWGDTGWKEFAGSPIISWRLRSLAGHESRPRRL